MTEPVSVKYFAYGSNMLPARLKARTPSAIAIESASLHGFRLMFCKRGKDGSAKCSIVPATDARVYGAVFRLDHQELGELDRVEGSGYERQLVTVTGLKSGEALTAATYIARAEWCTDALLPLEQYLQYVIDGARWHGLPADYIAYIEKVNAIGGS